MMHKSPAIKIVCMVAWVITALVALNIGLVALGFPQVQEFVTANMGGMIKPIAIIVGIAGLLSLISFAMMVFGMSACKCGCSCGGCNCDRGKGPYGGYTI